GVSYALVAIFFWMFARVVWARFAWLVVILWPYAVIQEACLTVASVVRYLTHSVTWKGRSVTAQNRNIHYLAIDE
ncbi:MAG TPA: hypothetical protein VN081_02800, partial [Dongiaceae bacterium]|nr:hypothetical protein [Dongiaceae bacterium]